jgi:hypothetical protein
MQQIGKTVLGATVVAVGAGCSTPSAPPPPPPPPAPASSAPPSAVTPATALPPSPGGGAPATVHPGASGTPRGAGPGINQVNGADASAVGEAFSTATFTYDSLIDTSPADGQRRSADFATPAFATALRQPLMQGGGALWNEMAAHRGYTTVALAPDHDDGRPPDTATSAIRGWTVTATGHAADGWSAPMSSVVLFVSMTRTTPASGWQVCSLRIPAAN